MSKTPKRRKDSYLGIHFDFHAGNDTPNIGAKTTLEMVEAVIEKVRPDFIQTDCKGHPGNSSYPTKVGNRARGLVTDRDTLKIWREATRKHGVALYLHYSGVWDTQACLHHPEWARTDENGKTDAVGITNVFGEYADQLLIPQLIELGSEYEVDGAWVDGECWATKLDYSEENIEYFRRATGIEWGKPPVKPEDPYFYEFMQWSREGFREYLRHYIDAVHAKCPDLQIASNWMFSSFTPEPVSADVDYISGDYPLNDSVNMARYEARCICGQGKPWDLMAWGFGGSFHEHVFTTKTAVQLQQEAASTIALGGGFQVYYTMNPDGSLKLWEMDVMAEVAKFCRAREEVCFRSEAVPQIALLSNGYDYYKRSRNVLSTDSEVIKSLQGALFMLLDAQNCVDVALEHYDFERYPVLVVPDNHYFSEETASRLRAYVENGGNLLLAGPHSVKAFEDLVNVEFEGDILPREIRYIECGSVQSASFAPWRKVRATGDTKVIGYINPTNEPSPGHYPAATLNACGKGTVCALHIGMLERYVTEGKAGLRDFLSALTDALYPEKLVTVRGTKLVDVIARKKDGNLNIHLINMGGKHSTSMVVYDEIAPLYDIGLEIRLEKKPSAVTLQPGGEALAHTYQDGVLQVTLEKLPIHEIISITP